ncbi:hypothetical protein D3C78_1134550 [compost metagenome]
MGEQLDQVAQVAHRQAGAVLGFQMAATEQLPNLEGLASFDLDGRIENGLSDFLVWQDSAFLNGEDIEVRRVFGVVEQPAVILAGLHQQGEAGQLGGTVVDVQAVEVFA